MTKQSEAADIVEAEKGKNLSPRNLHLRLRVLEVVTLVLVLLNLLHWYVAGTNERRIASQVDDVAQQTGVRQ